jgi:hypothetical protein
MMQVILLDIKFQIIIDDCYNGMHHVMTRISERDIWMVD